MPHVARVLLARDRFRLATRRGSLAPRRSTRMSGGTPNVLAGRASSCPTGWIRRPRRSPPPTRRFTIRLFCRRRQRCSHTACGGFVTFADGERRGSRRARSDCDDRNWRAWFRYRPPSARPPTRRRPSARHCDVRCARDASLGSATVHLRVRCSPGEAWTILTAAWKCCAFLGERAAHRAFSRVIVAATKGRFKSWGVGLRLNCPASDGPRTDG